MVARLEELGIQPGDGSGVKTSFTNVPLTALVPSANNPRTLFDEDAIQDLAASIAAHGLLQPIVVRLVKKGRRESYEIIAGERRFRALQLLQWSEVPVIIRDVIDDVALIEMALIENLRREGINEIERARGFQKLRDGGREVGHIAKTIGITQPEVSNSLRLLKLPDNVQELVAEGSLSRSHGIALASLADHPDDLQRLATGCVEGKWPSRHLETVVAAVKAEIERKLNPPLIEEETPTPAPADEELSEAPISESGEAPVGESEETAEDLTPESEPTPQPEATESEPEPAPRPVLATAEIPAPTSVPANQPRPVDPAPTPAASIPPPPRPAPTPTPAAPIAPPAAAPAAATPAPAGGMPGFVTLAIREELNAELLARRIRAKDAIAAGIEMLTVLGVPVAKKLEKIRVYREKSGEDMLPVAEAVEAALELFLVDVEEGTESE